LQVDADMERTARLDHGALAFMRSLWMLNHSLERLSSRMRTRIGVTAQQRLLLRCIGVNPGVSSGKLSEVLRVDPGTVSGALKRLEVGGFVTRNRDPEDRRRVLLSLTPRGPAIDRPMEGTVEHAVESLLADRPGDEISVAVSVVEQLARLLSKPVKAEG
jgi:DNA-binding MarR family transcriptional regulator